MNSLTESVRREIQLCNQIGIWDWNLAANEVWWSEETYRIFEVNRKSYIPSAQANSQFYHPDDLEIMGELIEKSLETGEALETELRLVLDNNKLKHCYVKAEVVRDESGTMCRFTGIIMDISELKRVETAIRDSEEKYRRLVHNLWAGVVLHAADTHILMANDQASHLLGLSSDQMMGKKAIDPAWCFMREDLSPMPLEEYPVNQVLASRKPLGNHIVGINRPVTQDVVWVQVNAFPEFDSAGELMHVVVTFVDVSDRRRIEASLRENEERLREVIDSTPFPIAMVDADDSIIHYWSKSAQEKFGHTAPTIAEWYQNAFPDPDYRQSVINRWKPVIEVAKSDGKTVNTGEYRVVCQDGSVCICVIYATFIKDYMIVTFNDITERIRTEEMLQKTQRLESLGILAGGIAHDFNNLLGGIFGNIELAQSYTDNPNVVHYLGNAVNAMDRARALTGQLLTFAKGGMPIKKPDRLTPFIEETTNFALSGSKVACRFFIPRDLWPCEYDKSQIGQVIDNIVINAKHAMPDGGNLEVTAENLQITEHPVLQRGRYIKITITDHGVGIPEAILPKIFDPFFTTKTSGHGLGLATCYSIIKRHNGCVEADSKPGMGSTFRFYLPAATDLETDAAPQTEPLHRGNSSILFMDDEVIIRQVVEDMLVELGYRVTCVSSSVEAVTAFESALKQNHPFTAVLLDLTIPGGPGGTETLQELRNLNSEIPAFVSSGYADDPVMSNPTQYGFKGSICKPFSKAELKAFLYAHLETEI